MTRTAQNMLVKGNTSGTAVPAGYVGEVVSATMGAGTTLNVDPSLTDINGALITLTPGSWSIFYNIPATFTCGSTAGNGGSLIIIMVDAAAVTTPISGMSKAFFTRNAASGQVVPSVQVLSSSIIKNLTATTTYKLRGKYTNNAGTNSGSTNNDAGSNEPTFYAIRIA
jgi:hypothetical protein